MPRHFSKMMQNPYFNTPHYQNESEAAKLEAKIESKIKFVLNKLKFWRWK
jgi:hypothetical protein